MESAKFKNLRNATLSQQTRKLFTMRNKRKTGSPLEFKAPKKLFFLQHELFLEYAMGIKRITVRNH